MGFSIKNPFQNVCIFPRKGFLTNLTPDEKTFLIRNPNLVNIIKSDADKALTEARNRFPNTSLHNDSGDAFRHCYWSALLARDIGEKKAREFTNAHENWCGNPPKDKAMDLHNNSTGIEIGKSQAKTITDSIVSELCKKASDAGKLKVITP